MSTWRITAVDSDGDEGVLGYEVAEGALGTDDVARICAAHVEEEERLRVVRAGDGFIVRFDASSAYLRFEKLRAQEEVAEA